MLKASFCDYSNVYIIITIIIIIISIIIIKRTISIANTAVAVAAYFVHWFKFAKMPD